MFYLLAIVPLLSVLILNLPFSKQIANRLVLWWGMLLCLAQVVFVLAMAPLAMSSLAVSSLVLPWGGGLTRFFGPAPLIDSLSLVMFLAIGLVGLASFMVSRYHLEDDDRLFLFANLMLLAMAGMNGVVLASNLFSVYVFLEVVAVSSFVLIAFERERRGFEGAFKYLILSAVATAMLLSAIAIFFLAAGGVSFDKVAEALAAHGTNPLMLIAVGLLVTGFLIKGGLVPFHGWVPDAYSSAPAGAAVLLSGIVTKTAGIYTLIRLLSALNCLNETVKTLLLGFGTLSLLVGALAALGQSDFRRMLAYSSISQMGYIVLGLGTGSALGLAGAVFHLFNHAVFKGLLFVNAAAVEKQTGLRDMNEMGGLGSQMPVTSATSVMAMLSTAGIPPFAGFWSKLMIVLAVWQAGQRGLAAVAVLGSLITLGYFLSLQRRVFFGERVPRLGDVKEAGAWILVPAVLLALITLGLGLVFPWLFNTFLVPVGSFI